jgi:hypothetical protein
MVPLEWPQLSVKPMKSTLLCVSVVAGIFTLVSPVQAQIGYSVIGSSYTQDFDSLPNTPLNTSLGATPIGWTDDNAAPGVGNFSIVGWYLYHPTLQAEGGFNGHQRMRIGAGTATTGAYMSFGPSTGTTTERALGALNSNTMAPAGSDMYIGLRLRNDTGQALYSFTLTYDGEQWRDGGDVAPNAQGLVFMWSTTAVAINDPNTSFTAASALDFTSPVFANTGSGAAVDGNVAGKTAGITATVEGINWLPGTDLWLRWNDVNNTGNDHGLAIDNISFAAAVPEPTTYALVGLGIASFFIFRRRK